MKVLHLVDTFLPRTENWIYPQIVDVPEIETAILCQHSINLVEFPLRGRPLFVQRLADGHWAQFKYVRSIIGRIESVLVWRRATGWRPDLVHAHFGVRGWSALPRCRALGVPLVTTFYGYDAWMLPVLQPEWRARYSALFAEGALFLVEGPAMRQRLIELGCPAEKIRIRTLGIEVDSIQWRAPAARETLKVAMVGRFVEKKGFVDGLRACAVAAKGGVPLQVTIVGDASEAPTDQAIKRELLEIAAQPELQGRVRFCGFLSHSDTLAVLEKHDVLLCPSRHAKSGDAEGGLPYVLTEVMAMGLIGVGSRHCDIPEAIVDGETGFLFEEGDVLELARILSTLAEAPVCLSARARAARDLVERKFNQKRQLAALAMIYREVLDASTVQSVE